MISENYKIFKVQPLPRKIYNKFKIEKFTFIQFYKIIDYINKNRQKTYITNETYQ